jgi:uncharacterized protein YhbP (UPF0306 family)
MADLNPYTFPDGTPEEQLRYAKQQYAEAMQASSVATQDKTVTRQQLSQLAAAIEKLERDIKERTRMHRVYSQHGRG